MSTERPLVTFAVFAYNQARFVREAVAAALAQTYSPLQVILSDDCSKDETFALMEAMAAQYRGPHRVVLNRNPKNLNIGGHINRVMELVEGELVVPAAADDVSEVHRTEVVVERWLASGKTAMSLHSATRHIDEEGRDLGVKPFQNPEKLSDREGIARHAYSVLGASHCWAREIFSRFGPLLPEVVNEDVALPFRSALLGHVAYIEEPLVRYRVNQSLWHDNRGEAKDHHEYRKRLGFLYRLTRFLNAQAYLDAVRFGDPRIERLVLERIAEHDLYRELTEAPLPRFDTLKRGLAGRTDPVKLAMTNLKLWVPGFNRGYLRLRGAFK
jgi:glycosyltransferase involved in cell wall biosynthesis